VRLPDDLVGWLERQAIYNGGTVSSEIAKNCRKQMEAEAKDRPPAGAGA